VYKYIKGIVTLLTSAQTFHHTGMLDCSIGASDHFSLSTP